MKREICTLALIVPVFTLLLPVQSSASPRPLDFSGSESSSGFFASAQYKLAFPYFKGLAVDSEGQTLDLFGLKQSETGALELSDSKNFQGKYSPTYLRSDKSGSVSVGYSAGNFRVEAEGMYQNFLVDDEKFGHSENAYKFAASLPKEGESKLVPVNPNDKYYVTAENKELTVASLMGNLCYDLIPEMSYISPSACVGGGGGLVKFLDAMKIRWFYQAKAGLQYFASSKTVLFLYGYGVKVHNEKFEKIPVLHHTKSPSPAGSAGSTTSGTGGEIKSFLYPNASFSLSYFGVEFGIRLVL